MESIKELYKIGFGPSSSHTMGPSFACRRALNENPDADFFEITLYGSLAKTGKGHRTDYAIKKTLKNIPADIIFNTEKTDIPHPNTMKIAAYSEKKQNI